MHMQQIINWEMRSTLLDWIVSVHSHFHWGADSLFLAANILDRFLSRVNASTETLQLIGGAALLIAAKVEETDTSPQLYQIAVLADGAFNEAELREAEVDILIAIGWIVSFPNPLSFLPRIIGVDHEGFGFDIRMLANLFCDVGIMDHRLLSVPSSLQAAAAAWLARLIVGSGGLKWVSRRSFDRPIVANTANETGFQLRCTHYLCGGRNHPRRQCGGQLHF